MVSIAILDNLIDASKSSPLFSVKQLGRDHETFRMIDEELGRSIHCNPIAILQVHNPILEESYTMTKNAYEQAGFPLNETILYHTTKAPLETLCGHGFTTRFSVKGLFGAPAIYLTDSMVKANRYAPSFGDISQIRAMIRCRVVLGNVKEFPVGHTCTSLKRAPQGFQSVKGFISAGHEFVVYSPTQVIITEVLFYRVMSKEVEQNARAIPINFTGELLVIHNDLALLFSHLLLVHRDCPNIFHGIRAYVKGELDLASFITIFDHATCPLPRDAKTFEKLSSAFASFSPLIIRCKNGFCNVRLPPFLPKNVVTFQLF